MIKFFRKIRQNLLLQNKTGKYFKYAIGEIVLVVIGILIALSINNWNEKRKARTLEINYLKNIQADLNAELKNNESMIEERNFKAFFGDSLRRIPAGKTKAEQLKLHSMHNFVLGWKNFIPTNNTFKELLSSGQLNSISSDSIKYYLLELDKIYSNIANSEDHMRREYEHYLYDTTIPNTDMFNDLDISTSAKTKIITQTDESLISDEQFLKMKADFRWLRNSQTYQNGLKLAIINNLYINTFHHSMTTYINRLIRLISEEIK